MCVFVCVCVYVCVYVCVLSSLEYIRPSVIQNGVLENYKFDLVDYLRGVSFDTLHMLASKVFSNQDTKLNQTILCCQNQSNFKIMLT